MSHPNRSQQPFRGRSWRRDPRARRYGSAQRENRPLLVRQEAAESDGIVEIQDEREYIEITTEFQSESEDGATDSEDGKTDLWDEEDVSREDVNVSLNGMELRIRVTPGEDREVRRDTFERRISLTRSVVVERADVSCDGSTLTITLPKTVPAA